MKIQVTKLLLVTVAQVTFILSTLTHAGNVVKLNSAGCMSCHQLTIKESYKPTNPIQDKKPKKQE